MINDNDALAADVEALVLAAEAAAGSALIEDYFFVSDEDMIVGLNSDELVGPFCVDGPGVFKFELSLTERAEDRLTAVMLLIDGVPVAQAAQEDAEAP